MDNQLEKVRKQIDTVDQRILNLLAKRLALVKKVGQYKKTHNISTLDQQRWSQVLELNLNNAKSLNLSGVFIKRIFSTIHQYSLKVQNKIKKP